MDTETSKDVVDGKIQDQRFKLIDYFITRLEHTISHTQAATKLIYLVNGAILAAVYFEFGKIKPISIAFLVGGILTLLLSIINFLHANFMAVQNAWYSAIDREIRNVFLTFNNMTEVWPKHLGDKLDQVLNSYKSYYRFFPFNRTHRVYVWIHLTLAIFLLFFSISFFYMSYRTPIGISIANNDTEIAQQTNSTDAKSRSAD